MNLRGPREDEGVELNLTPLIDVVFLLLIFFMVSTTFVRQSEIEITLPKASEEKPDIKTDTVEIGIDKQGRYYIAGVMLDDSRLETLRDRMREAAMDMEEPVIVINADSEASHQSVVDVMDVARQLGYQRLTFATDLRDNEADKR